MRLASLGQSFILDISQSVIPDLIGNPGFFSFVFVAARQLGRGFL